MAVATMRVPTLFTAVDRFSDVVSKMTNKTTMFSRSASSAINRVDHRLNNMWGSMNNISQLAIGGGVGGLFYYAGKDIMEYEKAIASLSAVTGTKIGAMNEQIESLAKTSRMSVIDVAKSFEIVGSKMSEYLDNPEALKQITEAGVILSRASRLPLEESINNLTQSLNIYKAEAKDAMRFVNKLSAGETVGSISIAQSTDILRQFGAQAVSTNVKLEESVALIQTLTKPLGVEGVGRGLRNILFDMSAPATWDKRKLAGIKMAGIDMKVLTNESLTFRERLKELEKFKGNNDAIGLFFKRTGTVAAKTLLQNIDVYDKFLDKINILNDAEDKAAKNSSTLSSMIDRLKASFTNFVVTGDNANGALSMTKSLIGWMTDNMGGIISLIEGIVIAFIGWKVIVGINLLVTKSILGVRWALKLATSAMRLYNIAALASAVSGDTFLASLLGVSGGSAAVIAMAGGVVAAISLIGVSMYVGSETTKKFGEANNTTFKLVTKQTVGSLEEIMSKMDSAIAKIKQLKAAQDSLIVNPMKDKKMEEVLKYDKKKLFDENVSKSSNDRLIKNSRVQAGFSTSRLFDATSGEELKNMAGQGDLDVRNLKEFLASKAGNLKLIIADERGMPLNVRTEGDVPKGVEVITTPNQGYRGN